MDPIKFGQSNITLIADGCRDLPAFKDDKEPRFITCWQMSPEEREEFLLTGKIYIQIYGMGHPPILPSVKNPIVDYPVQSLVERFENIVYRASKLYSFDFNLLKTSEECGELVQAICKRLSPGNTELEGIGLNYEIVSELIDVKLCIEALMLQMNESNIRGEMVKKLNRLEGRLDIKEQLEKGGIKDEQL